MTRDLALILLGALPAFGCVPTARRWRRAREAEIVERAIARHTLAIYAHLRDGRNRLYLPGDRYDDRANAQQEERRA